MLRIPILSASYHRPLELMEKESPTIFEILRDKGFVVPVHEVWHPMIVPKNRSVFIDGLAGGIVDYPFHHEIGETAHKYEKYGHLIFAYDIIWTYRWDGSWYGYEHPRRRRYEAVRIKGPDSLLIQINRFINRIRSSGQAEAC